MAPPVPEEYVQIVDLPSSLPVAWLEGDVLAEYMKFLEEAEEAAPVPGVKWLEGDVPAEYMKFLEEAEEAAPVPGVKWLEGDVLANFLQFLGEDEPEPEPVVYYNSSNSSSGSNGGDLMDEEEDDEEMEFLMRHITSLPAVKARAAAATAVQD